jgi:hypothetical protein
VNPYDEDYYLRGKQTGKSLYTNYRWMPELTIPMCRVIAWHLKLRRRHTVCDFGCARGYVVKAMTELGFLATGVDASEWAVHNCHPDVSLLVSCRTTLPTLVDWVIAKDVLEHIPDVRSTIDHLMSMARIGVFVVVPLSAQNCDNYVCEDYEKDITHCTRLDLPTWASMFMRYGWVVESSYRIPGIKDNWWKPGWEYANGFITARRQK